MFDRQQIKENAKIIMKQNYWTLLGMCIITILSDGSLLNAAIQYTKSAIPILIISTLLPIFIGNVIQIGLNRYLLEKHTSKPSSNLLLFGFQTNYINIVKIMFIMNLKTLLWTCLFIIPGIIKAYEYYMIPFILAKNPNIETQEAFKLSKNMTKNNKMNLFILELSFFGWILLGLLTCGIGLYFLMPYIASAQAEAFIALDNQNQFSYN